MKRFVDDLTGDSIAPIYPVVAAAAAAEQLLTIAEGVRIVGRKLAA
jgi:hypothetical protein